LSRLQLLKTLAPGFLPLIIFIGADALWGSRVGLAVAVLSGIIELAIAYVREKMLDRFVLLDTGLIVLLGSVSILMKTDIFFRLKPALVELIFCAILGISIYSPVNVIALMSRRYLKTIVLTREQLAPMMRSMKVMFFLFLGHTLLIVYAALAMSVKAWGFISGGLFYLLFGAYFLLEWGRGRITVRRQRKLLADEERFDIVDLEGKVLGQAPRSVCHSRPGFLHQVVHLHVINAEDQIFLQKRSLTKHIQPGKWDTAVGGHVTSGENIESALKREAEEELGLNNFKALAMARYLWETDIESELVYMFVSRTDQSLRLNRQEIDEGKFWKIKKIKATLGKNILTPNFEFEFAILLERFFKDS
jgi:isopentenyldiphosphate isomerase/intracellular septation protein A